jgi:uncharacterized sulfatase
VADILTYLIRAMNTEKIGTTGLAAASLLAGFFHAPAEAQLNTHPVSRPNILFAISDDQSFPYTSAYGTKGLNTPGFDFVARSGVLFNNAFVAAPQSSPSRAAILTGKNIWQLEEAGTHSSYFPKKFTVFTDLLEQSGYLVGFTAKAWGPGNFEDAGWSRNPAGNAYNSKKSSSVPASGINRNDYSGNFTEFYSRKAEGQPFFFWYGSTEPHRTYEQGSGLRSGKKLSDALVPGFLPSDSVIMSDILDYYLEIEYFDSHLLKIIEFLREKGELENTVIVVTADNGMSFPAAKANLMDYGTHVPLAICWPERIKGGRVSDDLVSMTDLAPTFLEITGTENPVKMTGKSLAGILFNTGSGISDPARKYVLTGRERHSHARPDNVGYPARAIRTARYLYIMNLKPERWPAGDPVPENSSLWPGFHDIDNGPSKSFILGNRSELPLYFSLAYERRSEEQLYDMISDRACLKNLAAEPAFRKVKEQLRKTLLKELRKQGDPRILDGGDVFDSYPRFGAMREFPGFREEGKYNPAFIKGK